MQGIGTARFAVGLFAVLGFAGSCVPMQATVPPGPGTLFVASDGNDAWSGTLLRPNRARSDGPFAALGRARDEVRKRKDATKQIGGGGRPDMAQAALDAGVATLTALLGKTTAF